MSHVENWESDQDYFRKLISAAELVWEPLDQFRKRLPYDEITSYRGRTAINHFDAATYYAHRQIYKELAWLRDHGHKSRGVVIGARGDLPAAARNLLDMVSIPEELRQL